MTTKSDEGEHAAFAPFFHIAGSGFAVDVKGTAEYRQMNHGWQATWTPEDDGREAHATSANPCVVYGVTSAGKSARDIIDACERATGGKVVRCFAPEGVDFAFVTFAEERHARACVERGVVVRASTLIGDDEGTSRDALTCKVFPARTPAPELVAWRARARARVAGAAADAS